MKEAYELLKKLEAYRAKMDIALVNERLPDGFSSRVAALTVVNGLDGAIEAMDIAVRLAQPMEDAMDERNTQEDSLK